MDSVWTQFGLRSLLSLCPRELHQPCVSLGLCGTTGRHVRYHIMVSVIIFEVLLHPPHPLVFP